MTSENDLRLTLELDRETDGRFIAEVPELPGVLVYGQSEDEAERRATALALRVLADRVERGELSCPALGVHFARQPEPSSAEDSHRSRRR